MDDPRRTQMLSGAGFGGLRAFISHMQLRQMNDQSVSTVKRDLREGHTAPGTHKNYIANK